MACELAGACRFGTRRSRCCVSKCGLGGRTSSHALLDRRIPTLGQSHSPNPVDGTSGLLSTQIELATNNDLANNPALHRNRHLHRLSGHHHWKLQQRTCATPKPGCQLRLLHRDIPSRNHGRRHRDSDLPPGDSKNGATTGTQTISFGPGDVTPEVPVAASLRCIAVGIGGGTLIMQPPSHGEGNRGRCLTERQWDWLFRVGRFDTRVAGRLSSTIRGASHAAPL